MAVSKSNNIIGNYHFVIGLSFSLLLVVVSSFVWTVSSSSSSSSPSTSNTKETNDQGSGTADDSYCDAGSTTTTTTTTTCTTTTRTMKINDNNIVKVSFHPNDSSLIQYHFESTSSTQNEAKRIAEEEMPRMEESCNQISAFCVTATEQTQGRGTNQRQWMGAPGNTFVTIGIRQSDWMLNLQPPVPLTLLPLKIGSLVAKHVQELLNQCYHDYNNHQNSPTTTTATTITTEESKSQLPLVTVKWPNDVLVNEEKISGVLIESSQNGWFLIGIGVNVLYAPPIPTSGPNHGRPSTSIQEHCPINNNNNNNNSNNNNKFLEPSIAIRLGIDLAYDLNQFLQTHHKDNNNNIGRVSNTNTNTNSLSEQVLQEWMQWIDWDMELMLRDTPNQERVKLINVLPDGRVQVQNVQDGTLRTLVTDYFF